MMKKLNTLLVFAFLCSCFSQSAEARIYIRIDEVAEKKFPIAITHLVNTNGSRDGKNWSRQVAAILKNDLTMAGLFEFVDPEIFPGNDAQNYKPESVNFAEWKLLGIQGLVKGGFTHNGGKVKAELYLYDPLVGQKLVSHSYNTRADNQREVAHHFADLIMETLTGYPGIFRTRLAFISKASKSKEVYTVGMDGSDMVKLTNDRAINLSPAWSPSGEKIAYTSYTFEGDAEIKVTTPGGSTKQVTKNGAVNLSPTWTPNGRYLTLAMSNVDDNIYNINLRGRIKRKLTNHWSIDLAPSWNANGSAFTFASERAGGLHVFRANSRGGNVQRLTFVGYQNDNPDWSPDGNRIVFQGRDQGVWDLFIMNPDGSMLQRLTADAGHNQEPTWAPNSQYIGFSSSRSGGYQLYIMDAQGENIMPLGVHGTQPDWGPLPGKTF